MTQPLIKFLKIIRWKNVSLYLLLQGLLYFVWFKKQLIPTDGWVFLVFSMIFFGIFGNIQNDLADYDRDRFKENFTDFNQTSYFILMLISLIIAFIFGFTAFYLTFAPSLLYAIISIPVLLSLYNYYLKKTPLIGNFIIALITVLAIFIPLKFTKNLEINTPYIYFLLNMSFWLSLLRELVKDMEDKDLDDKFGYKTLPVINLPLSRFVWTILSIITWGIMLLYKNDFTSTSYHILLLLSAIILSATTYLIYKNQYELGTKLLKLLMLIGIFSIFFF